MVEDKIKTEGSRSQVMNGNAKHTSGGLTKKDLKYNKHGSIVSKKKSASAKKDKRLEAAGFFAIPGRFGSINVEDKVTDSLKNNKKFISKKKAVEKLVSKAENKSKAKSKSKSKSKPKSRSKSKSKSRSKSRSKSKSKSRSKSR